MGWSLLNHPPLLCVVLSFLFAGTVESGFRMAMAAGAAMDDDRREQIAATREALGILLSLLLGFTLAMALPRFDARKQLLMEEANAIGTTSLRAELLPEPQASRTRELLRRYVEIRLSYSRAATDSAELAQTLKDSAHLQAALWEQARSVSQPSPSPITALFVSSLNDTIDVSAKRLAALENRIPPTIWLMLTLIAVTTHLTFGYGQKRRFWLTALVVPLMVAIVMGLIADLDSPRSGFLRADLRSLERLDRDLSAPPVAVLPASPVPAR